MPYYWWFILGLLVMFLVMWVVDWLYWRRRIRAYSEATTHLETALAALHSQHDQTERELKGQRTLYDQKVASLESLRGEQELALAMVATLRTDNERVAGDARARVGALQAERDQLADETVVLRRGGDHAERAISTLRRDVAELQQKLAAAHGVQSQLQAEHERLAAEIAALHAQGRTADADRNQLQLELEELHSQRDHSAAEISALHAQAHSAAEDREFLQGELDELRSLRDRNANELEATQAQVRVLGDNRDQFQPVGGHAPPFEHHSFTLDSPSLNGSISGLEAMSFTEADEQAAIGLTTQRDPLIDINGIGPVYQGKLFDAGVTTFVQLAAMSSDQIREIIKPQSWQEFEPELWIRAAAEFAVRSRSNA